MLRSISALFFVASGMASANKTYKITVTNLSYAQILSPFFVMSHKRSVLPLFEFGEKPTDELALLAELGDTSGLIGLYEDMKGVREAFSSGAAIPPASEGSFYVELNDGGDNGFSFVSFASMAVNTNDCFVGVYNMRVSDGMTFYLPGYDAGSEFNDESCANVPGPACADFDGEAPEYMEPEGFVHVHRGIQGTGDLSGNYDWRNPMVKVSVEQM